MHHLSRRVRALRAAVLAGVAAALLVSTGEALGASPAPAPSAVEPLAFQSSTRTRKQAPRKRPVRRVRRSRARATPVAPIAWTAPNGASALATDLSGMVAARVRSGRFGAMVASITRGDTLFALNAGEMLQPASTMKLLATAVALDRHGPEHTFSTDVLRDAPIGSDGAVTGNIYLRSDADPSMSSRFYRDPNLPMATLARSVVAAGVKRVTGDLVFDATAFDDRKVPEGWKTTYLGAAYAARVSALSLNENVVWVVVRPAGRQAEVTLEPMTTTIPVRSKVRLVGGRGGRIVARRAADGGIDVSGSIGASSGPLRYSLVVDDPAQFTAGALRAALQVAGVTIDGTVRPGKTPGNAEKVASLASPPLSRIVSEMNRESINIVAELLYRDAARATAANGMGTAETALANLREFMQKKVGANPQEVSAYDGSGLSTLDYMTPRAMIQLLSYAHRGPWSSAFHGSLPVAGESELLRMRMRATPAQGNLHAKTGTTNTVVSLAGYVTSRNGEILAFSFVYNGTDRWNAKSTIDAMGATLANFVRE
ncbi:MAG TPA: D-alanyl-D-alanine carboxypeptidase/D-alanyl-D-alanine-endopeptidase [Gemmatimonadaceae bacterium]|nr:D-alanyl-D-alanine carboxypeptidase/D-alanyl-D-alanine-endopeptidase [Gemmatimonadaceae bacterium]